MKDKIIEILKRYEFDPASGYDSQERHIDDSDFNKIAEDLVKLFAIPVVMRCAYCEEEITEFDTICKDGTGCMKPEPFEIEYKLELFREEQPSLFNENEERYIATPIGKETAEMMLQLINEMEKALANKV